MPYPSFTLFFLFQEFENIYYYCAYTVLIKGIIIMSAKKEDLRYGVMLRTARGMLNLTLAEVGEQIGVTAPAAGKWETGDSMIKASIFGLLQQFYKENGVIMALDSEGRPSVYLTEEGLDRVVLNPKKPPLLTLKEIQEKQMKM